MAHAPHFVSGTTIEKGNSAAEELKASRALRTESVAAKFYDRRLGQLNHECHVISPSAAAPTVESPLAQYAGDESELLPDRLRQPTLR